jgi:hypothetical protein
MACSGSSQVEKGTGSLPCLRRENRSSSAAATIRPSTTRAAAGIVEDGVDAEDGAHSGTDAPMRPISRTAEVKRLSTLEPG